VFPQLFPVLPNFHKCFYNSIEMQRTCFLVLLENELVYFDHRAIIMSTACASSVFLSSYRNTVLNQSVYLFALNIKCMYIN